MDRTVLALVTIGAVLLAVPLLSPPENVLAHNTGSTTEITNVSNDTDAAYAVYHYENLSERAKTLYVKALRNGGVHTVPKGEGAPEFQYPRAENIQEKNGYVSTDDALIVRPNNSTLPPADEPDAASRIELMRTRERPPDVFSKAYAPYLLSILTGLALIGTAGYLIVSGREMPI